jgi:TetR/AcrR family transcriptional regulator, transcriptional repressor for nem operon
MTKNSNTRELLIAEGLKSLILSGYDGVGINAVLDGAGVPKGSFYHFFGSKEDFVVAVLEAYERHYVDLRASIFGDVSRTPLRRLGDYFDEVERIHMAERPLGGCFYGVLAQTLARRSPEFKARVAKAFAGWEAQLRGLLAEAQALGEINPLHDPAEAAAFLIDAYEGALIRMKVEGGSAFGRFKRFALGSLSSGRDEGGRADVTRANGGANSA